MQNRIKELRRIQKMTQQKLADEIGKSKSAISKLESGKAELTLTMMHQLAKVLGCQPHDFIPGDSHRHISEADDVEKPRYPKSNHPFKNDVWLLAQDKVLDFVNQLPVRIRQRLTRESLQIIASWAYEDAYEQAEQGREIFISSSSLQSYLEKALYG